MVAGNEHVLRARFSDARFFFEEDLRKPLAQHLPRLATLTFHERLGSMLDKNQRVAKLVPALGRLLKLDAVAIAVAQEAAQLARADLATQMVVEMTSLQGAMGREYALQGGHAPEVADAIFEFWQPRSAGDALPASAAGTLLALTDRLDTLVGLFAANVLPRANADPYGLRRAALGLIRILCDSDLDIDLDKLLTPVAAAQPLDVSDETRQALLDFLGARLHAWLQEQGFAAETLEAVLAQQAGNPWRALNAARQLEAWRARPDWPTIPGQLRALRAHHPQRTTALLSAAGAAARAAGAGALRSAAASAARTATLRRRRRLSGGLRAAGAGDQRLL